MSDHAGGGKIWFVRGWVASVARGLAKTDLLAADSAAVSLLIALVLGVSLFRYLHTLLKLALGAPFIDFAHYYTYATVVAAGQDPFNVRAVASLDALLDIRRAQAAANYPPLFYLIMQPWTWLPFRAAALGWLAASQLFLLGALGLLRTRMATVSPLRVAAVCFVLLNYQPLVEDLALGQVNTLLLFLMSLAWWGTKGGRPWVAAVAVATAPFIKVHYVLLLPFLWCVDLRPILGRTLILMGAGLGVGLLILGPAHHLEYLRYVASLPNGFYARATNLALRGVLLRVFGVAGMGALVANALTLTLDIVLGVLLVRALRRSTAPTARTADWIWGLAVTAVLVGSPFVEEHYLVVLLLPLSLLLLGELAGRIPAVDLVLLVSSVVLLGGRYSLDQFSAFHHGAPSLLAAGKLVGAALLAWALSRQLRRSPGGGAQEEAGAKP